VRFKLITTGVRSILEKIRGANDARLGPLLKIWKAIEFKNVQKEIQNVVNYLQH